MNNMANDFENGRWVTAKGRRIFIKDGEDFSSALERSKKFRTLNNKKLYEENEKKINPYATNNNSGFDDNTSKYADKAIDYWKKQREDIVKKGGDTSWEDSNIKTWEKEKENRLYGEQRASIENRASSYQGRHTKEGIAAYKKEANDKIKSIITGQSRADKGLEKYGLRVERDNSAQKQFGKRYFGKNVDVIDDRTGKRIHSSYDNYFQSDNTINARREKSNQDSQWHTIKSGKYNRDNPKNVTNQFDYYNYLKKPMRDKTGDTIGNKVAQFKQDKAYIKQHEYDIKKGKEATERYEKVQQEIKNKRQQGIQRLKNQLSGRK